MYNGRAHRCVKSDPVAKEPEANASVARSGCDALGSSRHVVGRTATATSENMDVTGRRDGQPIQSSDGGGESRPVTSGTGPTLRLSRQPEASIAGVASSPSEAITEMEKCDYWNGRKSLSEPETRRPFRRPLAKDRAKTLSAMRPWDAEGISRSTWYRWRKAGK